CVVLLLRRRVLRLPKSVLLDTLVSVLGFAALIGALQRVIAHHEPTLRTDEIVITLVYPLADLVLVLLVVSGFGILGRQAGRAWWLLGLGLLGFVAADATVVSKTTITGGFVPCG